MTRERRPGEPLAKPRDEIAARQYANGATKLDAYEAAGFKPDRGNASRFFTSNDSVRERIQELLDQANLLAVNLNQVTREMVIGGILDLALNAKSDGARVAAWKLLGQSNVIGLFVSADENANPKSAPEIARAIAGDDDDLYRRILATVPLAPSEMQ